MYIYILLIFYACFLVFPATAQETSKIKALFTENLKLEIKTGAVTILSPVPYKYLEYTNDLNIPVDAPGFVGIFSAKRSMTPHLEIGYQLDYIRIQGKAPDVDYNQVDVRTQILTHCFQGQYNFKRNDEFKPLFNYFVYYKAGGVSVKNDRINSDENTPATEGKMNSNVAIMSGLGAGVNYQLNDHFSLTCSADINRGSDRVQEILYIHKLFYNSTFTVNKFAEMTIGLSYWFNLGGTKKNSSYKRSMGDTQGQIRKSKIKSKNGRSSKSDYLIWFNRNRGK